jgi:hypothetical protein
LQGIYLIAFKAFKICPAVFGNDGLHALFAVRAAGGVHRRSSLSSKTPRWNKSSRGAFYEGFVREKTMQAAIDRVMQTYCMIEKLTDEEAQAAREKVSSYLAEKPQADERALAVEGLRYLRSVRE